MKIILTNDDGIDAPGIRALQKAVNGEGVVVAPKEHLSGCGHQVTTTRPINVQKRSESEYAIGGTPVDCVRIALTQLCDDVKFVLSGINAGGNLGADAYISGTVAAVREATFLGVPAIAISHYCKRQLKLDWDLAARWTAKVLEDLYSRTLEPKTFWNVNLPHLSPGEPDPEIVFCEPSTEPLPVNYRIQGDNYFYYGEYASRLRSPGTDVDVCFSGRIAVTKIRL